MSEKKRVLITGFGSFGPLFLKCLPNISETIASKLCKEIKKENIFELDNDAPLIFEIIEKNYDRNILLDRLNNNKYDYVISMGRVFKLKQKCILERNDRQERNFFTNNTFFHIPQKVSEEKCPCCDVRDILSGKEDKLENTNFRWEFIHIPLMNTILPKRRKLIVANILNELNSTIRQ